jgi:hypothetical protein
MTIPFATSDSWTILSPIEQSIKRKIEVVGTPLRDWDVKINYGIKTGCNEAFIISATKKDELIHKDPKSAELIRPILRGRDIKRYGYEFAELYLIVAHNGYRDDRGNEVESININEYPAIKAHLDEYWDIISVRTDKGVTPYNLRNCAYMDDFSKQKLLWAETMRIHKVNLHNFPRFSYSSEPFYTDKTCFIATGENLFYILGFFNSSTGRYALKRTVSILDNGGYLMQKIYLESLLIPKVATTEMKKISDLAQFALCNDSDLSEMSIDDSIYKLFGFTNEEIQFIERDNMEQLSR